MRIGEHDIGVCSWSLRPRNIDDLAKAVRGLGLEHVQVALGGLITMDEGARDHELQTLLHSGLKLTAGMIGFAGEDYSTISSIRQTGGFVPDDAWESRQAVCAHAALLAQRLGLQLLSTHVGFVPPSSDDRYQPMVERICAIADIFARHELDLVMETGQEAASELLQFLNDLRCRNVFVNFDPANMILYGAGDPVEAVHILGRHIRHVHVKDAIASDHPGVVWGREVPFGTGELAVEDFFAALHSAGYSGPLVIEREAGDKRFDDVKFAIETLRRELQ